MPHNEAQKINAEPPLMVVDGRVFSTEACDRGMGRYVKFLLEVIHQAGYDICLVLYTNSFLKKNAHVFSLCKYIEYVNFDPSIYNEQDIHNSTYAIEKIIRTHKASAFIDTTPFLFPMRFDITTCPVIGVAYDLIPLKNPREYIRNQLQTINDIYCNGLRRLINADYLIAISNSSREEIMRYLGLQRERIGVIYPCLDQKYLRELPRVPKSKDFFAFVGGHCSKNPKLPLQLFNQLIETREYNYSVYAPTASQLNIIKSEFPTLTKNITIQHSIGEDEKILSQTQSKVVFHLSREEGFGIPLLEALFLGTRVVCCDIQINREILGRLGDKSEGIALLISANIEENSLLEIHEFINAPSTDENMLSFKNLRDFFLWHWREEAVAILREAIQKARGNHQKFTENVVMKMACNMPTDFCGVADYAYSICNSTTQNIFVYVADILATKLDALSNVRIRTYLSFAEDLIKKVPTLFHLAISERLLFGIELMRTYGSSEDIVILHDHNCLYGLYFWYFSFGDIDQFLNLYFVGADVILRDRIKGPICLSDDEFNLALTGYSFDWLSQKGMRVISHLTELAEIEYKKLNSFGVSIDNVYVRIGIQDRASLMTARMGAFWRNKKGIFRKDFLIGVFGSITNNKFIVEIALAVAKACNALNLNPSSCEGKIHFILCGKVCEEAVFDQAKACFHSLGLDSFFHYEHPLNEEDFDSIITAADMVLSCRKQDRGQLSHIVPRALSLGKLLVTNSKSGYSMILKNCRIEDDVFEEDLIAKILWFIKNRGDIACISAYNRKLFLNEHNATNMLNKILAAEEVAL